MTGGVVWLTGIPAAGKTTLAKAVLKKLLARGARAELLDGDELRKAISPDLDFTREGRDRQAARATYLALMLAKHGVWALVSLVSPYAAARARAREEAAAQGVPFIEVFVKCSLDSARRRDPKGLYRKAAAGEIQGLTGDTGPYEEPAAPEVVVQTDTTPLAACVDAILTQGILSAVAQAPVLLIGRGGTGTRLLSKLAQNLGIFLGNELNDSDDTLELVDLIYWLTMETATLPEPRKLDAHRPLIRETVLRMLAKGNYAPGRLWGWKLPETLFVLPYILDAFPRARVVHLLRHPASTILHRHPHLTANLDFDLGRFLLPIAYMHGRRDPRLIENDPHWLRGALSWEHQVSTTLKWCREKLRPDRYVEVRYEDIVHRASEVVSKVCELTGAPVIPWRPVVDPARINAPRPMDPDFRKLWVICEGTAAALGYEGPAADPAPLPVPAAPPAETA